MFELIKGNGNKHKHSERNISLDIKLGDKINPLDNTRNSCVALSKELNKLGYETRITYNEESNKWSVALISKRGI